MGFGTVQKSKLFPDLVPISCVSVFARIGWVQRCGLSFNGLEKYPGYWMRFCFVTSVSFLHWLTVDFF